MCGWMGFSGALWVCWSLPVYFIRRNRRLVAQFKAIFWQAVFFFSFLWRYKDFLDRSAFSIQDLKVAVPAVSLSAV